LGRVSDEDDERVRALVQGGEVGAVNGAQNHVEAVA
jgi:hypothetical protein